MPFRDIIPVTPSLLDSESDQSRPTFSDASSASSTDTATNSDRPFQPATTQTGNLAMKKVPLSARMSGVKKRALPFMLLSRALSAMQKTKTKTLRSVFETRRNSFPLRISKALSVSMRNFWKMLLP